MPLTRPRYSSIIDADYKQSVRVATTEDVGNIAAGGNMTDTVDTIGLVLNDRILVKDQSDGTQNGIYYVSVVGTGSNGTWIRAKDANSSDSVTSGMTTIVAEGSANGSKTFRLTTADPITLGTTSLTFTNPFGAATAGGSDTQIQYNSSSALAGSSAFTFNTSSNTVTITGNINSTNGNIANLTSSNLVLPGTLTIGTQQIITQGNDGFSVNENFNIGNSTITGYHYTSGAGRESVAFTLARTGQFTNGFGITGTSSDNKFVIGGEFGNTAIQFKKSIGMPFNVAGGTTLFEILPSGNLSVYGNVIPSANVAYSLGSENFWWKDLYLSGGTIYLGGLSIKDDNGQIGFFNRQGNQRKSLGNVQTVAATGNITTDGFFIGNGSQLTGLPASYGNTEVEAYLTTNSYTTETYVDTANSAVVGYIDNEITTVNSSITTANTAMKGYVDGQVAGIVDSAPETLNTLNELAAALGDDPNLATTLTTTITTANTAMKGYVDGEITSVDSAITTANLAMVGYVDNAVSTANTAVVGYVDDAVSTANTAVVGYVDDAVSTANTAVVGYVDNSVTTANTAMKGYVDGEIAGVSSSYGNTEVGAYLPTHSGNVAADFVNANFFTGNGSQLTGLPAGYGDADVDAHLSGGTGVTYSSGTISIGQAVGTGSSVTFAGITIPSITKNGTDGTGNIGQIDNRFGTIYGVASSAQYADLAEKYISDKEYAPGTVVVFGGPYEITESTQTHQRSIAGVISTAPAYLMNDDEDGLAVALQGRVPCQVLGPIRKGDLVVASEHPGIAQRLNDAMYRPGCVIGKALNDIETAEVVNIEVVVGRL